MRLLTLSAVLSAAFLFGFAGCSTVPEREADRKQLDTNVDSTLKTVVTEDPSLRGVLDRSAGYAIFPSVGKGGFIAGGAYGRGHVFQDDQWVGYSDLTQGSIGAQAGGQPYHEVIVFQDKAALEKFKTGQYALAANASAVIIKANAASAANFSDGVLVFVKPEGGLMFEAAIGGQKFSYVPTSAAE